MGEHKLESTTVRDALYQRELERTQRIQRMRSVARFNPIAAKPRLTTRGEPQETWRTKAWTPARRQSRDYDLKMARDRADKARSKAEHTARADG